MDAMATKKQIHALRKVQSKIEALQSKLSIEMQSAGLLIEEVTGIGGIVDWLPGDGVGFTCSDENVPTFVPFGDLIKLIEIGEVSKDELIALASL